LIVDCGLWIYKSKIVNPKSKISFQPVAGFIYIKTIVSFKSEQRHRIITMSPSGPASEYPVYSHGSTGQRTVNSKGIECVLGTGWNMAAGRPQMRRYSVPVKIYGKRQEICQNYAYSFSHQAKIAIEKIEAQVWLMEEDRWPQQFSPLTDFFRIAAAFLPMFSENALVDPNPTLPG